MAWTTKVSFAHGPPGDGVRSHNIVAPNGTSLLLECYDFIVVTGPLNLL